MIQKGKANIIIGGQWGSEGKGKLAGWLYHKYPEISIAVSDFTPNTGHTYVDENGKAFVSKIIPIGMAFESVKTIIIGPHAVFSINRFHEELQMFRNAGGRNTKVLIHPMASVLTAKNIADEARTLNAIASTMQGSAAAQIAKIMRNPKLCHFAKDDTYLRSMITDTHCNLQYQLRAGATVLIETGQGFDLGLNHGHEWPYVTGRDCMIGRWLDSAGVHPKQLGSITVALRTYPIRVGNTEGGYSGPWHVDQNEMSWESLSSYIGRDVKEYTTVTKRVRRLFTWSDSQVRRMCLMIKPDYAFLNFVNYLRGDEVDQTTGRIGHLLRDYGCQMRLLGTGAGLNGMTDLGELK
jgi:adenylosuccinate synthase